MNASLQNAARPFTPDAITRLLSPTTRLLGFGEPTHGVEAFLELRNELFRHLVEHEGYRSIAIESDILAGLIVDAYVTEGTGTLDDVMSRGYTHGVGASAANRDLVRWMRDHNRTRPAQDRLRFYGFDGPLEITGPESPRAALTTLHRYLAAHLELFHTAGTVDRLLGADERWTNPDATLDPAQSIGRSPEAKELRLIADDLLALHTAHSPHLIATTSREDWWRAGLHGRVAADLLRYHGGMADSTPARLPYLMDLRDMMMAGYLADIVRRSGPTLAFAHNLHLKRDKSRWHFAGKPQAWWSAGAIISASLGDEYAYVASTFGTQGDDVPAPDTVEGVLSALTDEYSVIDPRDLDLDGVAARVPASFRYFALDPATANEADGIVFVKEIPPV
ncbi:erythromycin esterase family protein [Nonomuraea sp. NPDC046802]|uniref:erythromycin esterase family protein n=1 Tax=Nonomuraea sp. NPDC046802 TaxID=3154919 RepID=UPI0033D3949B